MPKRDLVRRTNQMPGGVAVAGGATILLMPGGGSSGEADTVDGLHASAEPQAGALLPLGGDGLFPQSVIPSVIDLDADYDWTGDHTFQGGLTARHILPEAPDAYDLGSSTKLWRKGYISELDAVVFAEQTAALVGGWLIVPHGQGTLAADVGTADTTVDFGQAMTLGDFVCLRAPGAVEYMEVGSLVSGTTYNVTRDLDGSGADAWPAGTVYLVLGAEGDGRIELNASDTPRIQVLTQGATYNAQSEVVRIGSLAGSFGVVDERYGFGLGDYAADNYMRYEPEGGFLLRAGGGGVQIDNAGITIASDADDGIRFSDGQGGFSRIYDKSALMGAGKGGLGLFSSSQYWGIEESGGAKLAMDAGFLKLQPRSGNNALMAFGDASNNYAMFEFNTASEVETYLGTGAEPQLQFKLAPQYNAPTQEPRVIVVSLDIAAGGAKTIATQVTYALVMVGGFIDVGDKYSHYFGHLWRPASSSTQQYPVSFYNFATGASSSGGAGAIYVTSAGNLGISSPAGYATKWFGIAIVR